LAQLSPEVPSLPRPVRRRRPPPQGASGTPREPCVYPRLCRFIGHKLDTSRRSVAKCLILMALPRGLEPLFSL
jgi:hypothetical protein